MSSPQRRKDREEEKRLATGLRLVLCDTRVDGFGGFGDGIGFADVAKLSACCERAARLTMLASA